MLCGIVTFLFHSQTYTVKSNMCVLYDVQYGRTPLCKASLNGHLSVVQALLSAPGIAVNQADMEVCISEKYL